ncbi:hypothetical protein Acsp05_54370 [Actinokineospora sp. NBRC 105648]|nr:hypothetical protein Acsp05_54370 [Actinokineospora sp. NBRC 105648]
MRETPKFPPRPEEQAAAPAMIVSALPDRLPWAPKSAAPPVPDQVRADRAAPPDHTPPPHAGQAARPRQPEQLGHAPRTTRATAPPPRGEQVTQAPQAFQTEQLELLPRSVHAVAPPPADEQVAGPPATDRPGSVSQPTAVSSWGDQEAGRPLADPLGAVPQSTVVPSQGGQVAGPGRFGVNSQSVQAAVLPDGEPEAGPRPADQFGAVPQPTAVPSTAVPSTVVPSWGGQVAGSAQVQLSGVAPVAVPPQPGQSTVVPRSAAQDSGIAPGGLPKRPPRGTAAESVAERAAGRAPGAGGAEIGQAEPAALVGPSVPGSVSAARQTAVVEAGAGRRPGLGFTRSRQTTELPTVVDAPPPLARSTLQSLRPVEPPREPQPEPSTDQPEDPPAKKTRPRWLLPAAAVLVAALVAALVAWLTSGDEPPPVRPRPEGAYLFQRMGETAEPLRDSDCAAHAYGEVKQFLTDTPCRQLSRAVFLTVTDDGRTVHTAIAVIRMPDRSSAERLELLARQDATGSVNDLVRERRVSVPGLDRLSQGGFAATSFDRDVVIAESDSADRKPDLAAHRAEMKRVSDDALRLGRELG